MDDKAVVKGLDRNLIDIIVRDAIMGILVFDAETTACVYVNRLASESLELTVGADQPTFVLFLNDLFPVEARARGSASAHPLSIEMVKTEGFFQNVLVKKSNGLLIFADVAVKHVTLEDGSKRVLLMFQDTTIQKRLQREIEVKQEEIRNAMMQVLEQNRQLMVLDSAKDRFIALTTHELRTPLAAIVATAEVLQMKLYESEEQKEDFIKTLHEQGLHLMELVNDILDLAKIRAGKMDFFVEQLDLAPLLKKIASSFDHMASQAQVAIHFESGAEIKAFADRLRLKEVVSNVINNAIKYNRSGGQVRLKIELVRENKFARISVSDTGQGIPPGKIQHVFNEFETVGNVALHHKGTGLGMPISKRLIEAMGGSLTLESREGVGSTFFVEIPMEKVLPETMYGSRGDAWGDDLAA